MRRKNRQKNKGFTLVEMIMVIGIFIFLTAITVFNYGDFNSDVTLTNLAYEVALEIRQAQTYALGVRAAGIDSGLSGRSEFEKPFGVYFNIVANNQAMVSFADSNDQPNRVCDLNRVDPGGTSCSVNGCDDTDVNECHQFSTLTRGIFFDRACISDSADPIILSGGSAGSCNGDLVDELNITFKRPNPTAIINGDGAVGKHAGIVLESSKGSKRAVIIRSTGQISVENIE